MEKLVYTCGEDGLINNAKEVVEWLKKYNQSIRVTHSVRRRYKIYENEEDVEFTIYLRPGTTDTFSCRFVGYQMGISLGELNMPNEKETIEFISQCFCNND